MIVSGYDVETTGLSQKDGHRLIEAALLHYDFDTRKLVDKFVTRIDPERSIEAKAQAVHGIAYDDLVGSPKWEVVAPQLQAELNKSDLTVIHNGPFDAPFTNAELKRVGLHVRPDLMGFCTLTHGRWATPDGKSPKLGELCFALNLPYDPSKAHAAEYDVERMMACFFAGVDRGFYFPDRDWTIFAAWPTREE
ncbi:3'-5' exonuclease [Paraburkholderia nemoris]|uniref:3'-5' exonuclease n=1 Tax=Paraburkholderia nemoris TaxID=2793076 RepID=UPI0038BAE735